MNVSVCVFALMLLVPARTSNGVDRSRPMPIVAGPIDVSIVTVSWVWFSWLPRKSVRELAHETPDDLPRVTRSAAP